MTAWISSGVRHPTVSAKLTRLAPHSAPRLYISMRNRGSVREASSAANRTCTPWSDATPPYQGRPRAPRRGAFVFVPDVEVRGRDEDADHINVAVEGRLDIRLERPCKAADPGVQIAVRDRGDAFLLRRRHHGKPGLDHLHADLVKRSCDRYLLITGKRDAGSLLPVSQRYITDLDIPGFHGAPRGQVPLITTVRGPSSGRVRPGEARPRRLRRRRPVRPGDVAKGIRDRVTAGHPHPVVRSTMQRSRSPRS